MKIKIFGIIAAVCIIAVAAVNVYNSQPKDMELSTLVLANVEALANNGEKNDYIFYVNPCPTGPGNECSSAKTPYGCVSLSYCP